jgi:hypothetical protein
MAIHAYSVQDAYTYGFALQERVLSHQTREEWVDVAKRSLRQYGRRSTTTTHTPQRYSATSPSTASATRKFLFGLGLILEGLDQRLPRTRLSSERPLPSPACHGA